MQHGSLELLQVGLHAVPADVEVAFFAVVEGAGRFGAEMALSLRLELCQLKFVFVVASVQLDRPALEAITFISDLPLVLFLAEHAPKFYAFYLVAF